MHCIPVLAWRLIFFCKYFFSISGLSLKIIFHLIEIHLFITLISMVIKTVLETCSITKHSFYSTKKYEEKILHLDFQLASITRTFNMFAQNIVCGYTLEPPRRGGSNEYPQSMFWNKNKNNRYTPENPIFSI